MAQTAQTVEAQETARTARLLAVAQGREPADLVVRGARLVNVLAGEIHRADLVVADGLVAAVDVQGEPGPARREARREVDAAGRWLCPGLVEGHIHVESTLLTPARFARAVAERGTAAVVCDPHEIANVLGEAGVRWMLDATRGLPVAFFVMIPSCVPATHLETSGATLDAAAVARLLAAAPGRVPGLGEMMNFPGVLAGDGQVMAKLAAARGRKVDGHAPGLEGAALSAYVAAGPDSDHESTTVREARAKLRRGMHLMLREGSAERNLLDLLPVVNEFNAQNCSLVTDDRHPDELVRLGHLDHAVRLAMGAGVPPVRAVQMASINTARHFGLTGRGALAPGWRADFVLLDDLQSFAISECWLGGRPVAELDFASPVPPPGNGMRLGRPVEPGLFAIPAAGRRARVIGVVPGQIVTEALEEDVPLRDGLAVADPGRDLAKLAVVERHAATGNVGLGLVRGLGLARGAVASSVAHDSHNIVAAGMDDADLALAVRAVADAGGGLAAALDGRVLALLPLPVAGLMADRPAPEVAAALDALNGAARGLLRPGHGADSFMTLSFLALPVIPALKLTDRGLVDVARFGHVPLFVE